MADEYGNMTPEESFEAALAEPVTDGEQQAAGEVVDAPDDTDTPEAAPKTHPAWEEAWKDVPEPIRELQRPYFEKMDRDYQHLLAKHSPYKEFEENGVDPDYIKSALGVQQAILNNPADFYNRMGEAYGLTPTQVAKLKLDDPAGLDDDGDDWEDPRLASLAARVEAQEQRELYAQQQQQLADQEQQEQWQIEQQQAQIDAKLDEVASAHGDFDREEVVLRAIANLQAGKNPSIENAFFELKAYEDRIAQRVVKNAPKVLGAGGGSGTQHGTQREAPKGPLTPDQLLELAMAEGKRVAESFGNN